MKYDKQSKHEIPLSIVVFMLILFFISKTDVFIYLAFGIGLVSLLSKRMTNVFIWLWTRLLKYVGLVNTHLILGVIFFIVLFPISLIYRMWNKDSMNLKAGKDSYFIQRDHLYTAKDVENPW